MSETDKKIESTKAGTTSEGKSMNKIDNVTKTDVDGKGLDDAVIHNRAFFIELLTNNKVQFFTILICIAYIVWGYTLNNTLAGVDMTIDIAVDAEKLVNLYLIAGIQSIALPIGIAGIVVNLIGIKIKTKLLGVLDAIIIAMFCIGIWLTMSLLNG